MGKDGSLFSSCILILWVLTDGPLFWGKHFKAYFLSPLSQFCLQNSLSLEKFPRLPNFTRIPNFAANSFSLLFSVLSHFHSFPHSKIMSMHCRQTIPFLSFPITSFSKKRTLYFLSYIIIAKLPIITKLCKFL